MKTEAPINERISQLLDRVANLKRASDLKPVQFDARGEAAANRIAARDRGERESQSGRTG